MKHLPTQGGAWFQVVRLAQPGQEEWVRMAKADRGSKEDLTGEKGPVIEKPTVHTRWFDGSKYIDPDELGRSEVFRRTVEKVRRIEIAQRSR